MNWFGTYRFSFSSSVPMDDVEDTLMVAVLAVESLVGRPALKLDASFRLDKRNRVCSVDAGTPAGKQIARIFAGMLVRELGENSFSVERESGPAKAAALA